MHPSQPLSGLILAAMLIGCTTLQVNVDYDPTVDLHALRTYDWAATPQEKAGDPLIDSDTLLRQRVVNAVDGELARRGFRRTSAKPGFLVTFFYTRDRKVIATGYPYMGPYGGYFGGPYYGYWGGWYYPGYSGYGFYPRQYDEGLLVIDFIDPTSRKLLWRGMVRDYLRFQDSPETRDLRIHGAVVAVLDRFPPR